MSDWLPTSREPKIGRYPTWKTIHGTRVLYGRHDLLAHALEDGARVLTADGELVTIEHVTAPNDDNYAYAWPAGTQTEPRKATAIRQANHVSSQRPRVRWHNNGFSKGVAAKKRRKRR